MQEYHNKKSAAQKFVPGFISSNLMAEVPIYTLDENEYEVPYYYPRTDYVESYQGTDTAIVIDNGSNQCRAGWADESTPSLVFDNVVSSNVVCDFDRMENVLDYIFTTLGISDSSIAHPIVMTEPVCVPQYSRKHMHELLFECYGVPKVTFGIDALFSYYANDGLQGSDKDGYGDIIVSAGHNATHIIPTLHGKGLLERTARLRTTCLS
ncbi:hypothetical protein BX666DRAFT_137722 [Dichotomocladium elegans]|nr:hypothetical protein BX666DRAFT_137722 [Dichotomocladium elegans]